MTSQDGLRLKVDTKSLKFEQHWLIKNVKTTPCAQSEKMKIKKLESEDIFIINYPKKSLI